MLALDLLTDRTIQAPVITHVHSQTHMDTYAYMCITNRVEFVGSTSGPFSSTAQPHRAQERSIQRP